jgi:hypothetical protein
MSVAVIRVGKQPPRHACSSRGTGTVQQIADGRAACGDRPDAGIAEP